jgi:hypothetical protein
MTCRLQISCCPALLRPPEFGKQQRFPTVYLTGRYSQFLPQHLDMEFDRLCMGGKEREP